MSVFKVERARLTAASLYPSRYWIEGEQQKLDTVPLIEVVDIVSPKAPSSFTCEVLHIDSSSFSEGFITDVRVVKQEDLPKARCEVKCGDVLLSTLHQGKYAAAIVPPSIEGALCSGAVLVLRPRLMDSFTLWCYLRSSEVRAMLKAYAISATNAEDVVRAMAIPRALLHGEPPRNIYHLLDKVAMRLPLRIVDPDEDHEEMRSMWGLNVWEQVHAMSEKVFTVSRDELESRLLNPTLRFDPNYHCSYRRWIQSSLEEPKRPLRDLADIVVGTPAAKDSGDGHRVIGPSNIKQGRIDLTAVRTLTLKRSPVTVEEGDVLVVLAGAQTGEVALVAQAEAGYVIDNNLARVRVRGGECSARYLAVYLGSEIGWELMARHVIATTTPSLPISGLAEVLVPLYSLEWQSELVRHYDRAGVDSERGQVLQQLLSLESAHWRRLRGNAERG